MLEVKVTGNNSKELVDGLQTLLATLTDGPANWDPKPVATKAKAPVEKPTPVKKTEPKPKPDPAIEAPKAHTETPEPDNNSSYYTLPQIRAIATDLIHKNGGREKLKTILKSFGVTNLSELDPTDFAWFANKVTEELK
ncbi:hypothetical protein [Schleiferilactobacillus perolens]|uniref:Uncharacterized protein n=1 Tax=Schleiferilactobacillus perolens DSM 12744 TaxID=1423792 RepID=A0A0R1N843_9LACO|nr:hypothetical protein [Schleiferilactobacillus perolens]KRL13035.1 hypothetical protein FD09_GL002575 [Schleiferilactobacillus perolens DSM 12744]